MSVSSFPKAQVKNSVQNAHNSSASHFSVFLTLEPQITGAQSLSERTKLPPIVDLWRFRTSILAGSPEAARLGSYAFAL